MRSLEGKKKEQVEVEEKETILRGKDFGVHFFSHNTKSSSFGRTQKLYWMRFWGFWKVYINSSNLIYVVIIFLKLDRKSVV